MAKASTLSTAIPPSISAAPKQQIDDALLAFCKASGDQLRLQVLRLLSRDAFSVQELCEILAVSQSGMSHHLKLLAKAGLVNTRREGNSIYYRRALRASTEALDSLQHELMLAAAQIPLAAQSQERLERVKEKRAEQSQRYFAENAEAFAQQQEQMVSYSLYGQATLELLDESQTVDGKRRDGDLAIEVGPGEGEFLPLLTKRFKQVIALDNSERMLKQAARTATSEKLRFILGDTKSQELPQGQADCVVMNMVLHHVSSPADIFSDAAQLLKTGGVLCVTDLCSHDQNWAREACGDLWLGFDPDDLSQWASSANLLDSASAYLAQRNGFQVQIRQFTKL